MTSTRTEAERRHVEIGWAWSTDEFQAGGMPRWEMDGPQRFSQLAWSLAMLWPVVIDGAPRKVDAEHPFIGERSLQQTWWACEWPEREYRHGVTAVSNRCRECVIALGAAAVNRPRMTCVGFKADNMGHRHSQVPLRVAYEYGRERFDLPVLPERAQHGLSPRIRKVY